MTDPAPYDRDEMDTIFIDHKDQKFWSSQSKSVLSPDHLPLTLYPCCSSLRPIANRPSFATRRSRYGQQIIGGPGRSKSEIDNVPVHAPFTLVHANSRSFTLFF